jgi:hypothetical protein
MQIASQNNSPPKEPICASHSQLVAEAKNRSYDAMYSTKDNNNQQGKEGSKHGA